MLLAVNLLLRITSAKSFGIAKRDIADTYPIQIIYWVKVFWSMV